MNTNTLTKNQYQSAQRQQKRLVGKYLAMHSEHPNLQQFMVSLSPIKNDMATLIEMRKEYYDDEY